MDCGLLKGKTVVLAAVMLLLLVTAATETAMSQVQQDWVNTLLKSAQPLRTIDPAVEDFSDLEPLGKAIGDASIVFLGEQSHGDGGAITARSRLVIAGIKKSPLGNVPAKRTTYCPNIFSR